MLPILGVEEGVQGCRVGDLKLDIFERKDCFRRVLIQNPPSKHGPHDPSHPNRINFSSITLVNTPNCANNER